MSTFEASPGAPFVIATISAKPSSAPARGTPEGFEAGAEVSADALASASRTLWRAPIRRHSRPPKIARPTTAARTKPATLLPPVGGEAGGVGGGGCTRSLRER